MKPLYLMLLLPLAFAGAAGAQTTSMDVDYTWTVPTAGTAVDHYIVEHSIDGGAWSAIATTATNTFTLSATVGQSHQIRVAGVDAANRQGPFSEASDPYTPDAGVPSAPGKPIIIGG